MSANGDSNGPDPIVREIQTQHPGIAADEIQGAIETLRETPGRSPAQFRPSRLKGLAGPHSLMIDATSDGLSLAGRSSLNDADHRRPEPGRPPSLIDATSDGMSATRPRWKGPTVQITVDGASQAVRAQVRCRSSRPAKDLGDTRSCACSGRGAMGAVYLAYDPQLGCPRA